MSNELINVSLTENEWELIIDAALDGTAHIKKPNEMIRAIINLEVELESV